MKPLTTTITRIAVPMLVALCAFCQPLQEGDPDIFYALALIEFPLEESTAGASSGLLATTGRVASHQKINDLEGGFAGDLDMDENFGEAIAAIGDLDLDGVPDLAVGAPLIGDGALETGAVFILFMNTNGTVKAHQKIGATDGNFTATLDEDDFFGSAIAVPGDLDGDGITDLYVGSVRDDEGGSNRGAVYILYMNRDGTVKSHAKITDTTSGFTGTLSDNDQFGHGVAAPGDINGDGIPDMVVGAHGDAGNDHGAAWVLFLNTDGTVKAHQKISDTVGGFNHSIEDFDYFGLHAGDFGDFDGDGIQDIVVTATGDNDGGPGRGAAYMLFLNANGTVQSTQKISSTSGHFVATWNDGGAFGAGPLSPTDLDGDGIRDLVVGAVFDGDGGNARGAIYSLYLNADASVKSYQKVSDTEGGFSGVLTDGDAFGGSIAYPGDLNGDGVHDLVVGAIYDDTSGNNAGSIYVLFLEAAE